MIIAILSTAVVTLAALLVRQHLICAQLAQTLDARDDENAELLQNFTRAREAARSAYDTGVEYGSAQKQLEYARGFSDGCEYARAHAEHEIDVKLARARDNGYDIGYAAAQAAQHEHTQTDERYLLVA